MGKKADKIIIELDDPAVILVNGKKYRMKRHKGKIVDGILHGDRLEAIPFDEAEHKKRLDLIVDAISKHTNTEEMLRHSLKDLETDILIKIEKLIRKKAKIKKQKGCIGFKFEKGKDKQYINIIG